MKQLFQDPGKTFCGTSGSTRKQKQLNNFYTWLVDYNHGNVTKHQGIVVGVTFSIESIEFKLIYVSIPIDTNGYRYIDLSMSSLLN